VSVDYSSVIQALGVARFRELVVSLGPAVTFTNHHEVDMVGPLPFPPGASVRVVKLGARGCLVDSRLYPARPIRPVDTTGAGDAFAAGGLLDGPALALRAAGRCVAKLDAMP
jgi:sugar/nucleoside kinase (ribokinase family)